METKRQAPPHFSDLRRANGISLDVISQRTRIPVNLLEDLERKQFEAFPPGIFARSYVRAYAKEALLDPDVVLAHVIRKLPGDEALTRVDEVLSTATPTSTRGRTEPWTFPFVPQARPAGVAGAFLVLIVVLGLWLIRSNNDPAVTTPLRAVAVPLDVRPVATTGTVAVAETGTPRLPGDPSSAVAVPAPVTMPPGKVAVRPPRKPQSASVTSSDKKKKSGSVNMFSKVGGFFKKAFTGEETDKGKGQQTKRNR